jgi:hypothetical protein
MQKALGEEGSQQRNEVHQSFPQQLQHDPSQVGENAPEDRSLWQKYLLDINDKVVGR